MKGDLTELQLFGVIESLGAFIFFAQHDAVDGRIEWTEELYAAVTEAQVKTIAAALDTARFGVVDPVDDSGMPTPAYREWYAKMKLQWYELEEEDRAKLMRDAWEQDDDAA